ncbi:hypothetical protein [Ekhidna sp. To15]|uniref:hypothetical protein n=1 Tax=Ekhidna sp. To15 TaxID=3395267 RepID=UPI003F51FE76
MVGATFIGDGKGGKKKGDIPTYTWEKRSRNKKFTQGSDPCGPGGIYCKGKDYDFSAQAWIDAGWPAWVFELFGHTQPGGMVQHKSPDGLPSTDPGVSADNVTGCQDCGLNAPGSSPQNYYERFKDIADGLVSYMDGMVLIKNYLHIKIRMVTI